MAAVNRFSIALVSGLLVTLSIKSFVAASVLRPDNVVSAQTAARALEKEGFQVAGQTTFAGRVAIMAAKDECLLYIIPVSEQGWHQETVRTALQPTQRLYFLYNKNVYADTQPRWATLTDFYFSFALAHMGVGSGYNPVFAIAAAAECKLDTISWKEFGHLPYQRAALFTHSQGDDY